MEFDISRCYSAINADELKQGDKVIGANTLSKLRERVEQFEETDVVEIGYIAPDTEARRFNEDYLLAYLVERKENCTNCIENDRGCTAMGNDKLAHCWNWKPITKQKAEHKCETCKYVNCGFKGFNTKNECDRWEEEQKAERHTDYNHCEEARKAYACAMTNVCPNKHYRPFRDTDELVKVWDAKIGTPKWGTDGDLTMPHIWVKYKGDDTDRGRLIISFSNNGCSVIDVDEIKVMLWEGLFEKCVFLDGSPCGVEE